RLERIYDQHFVDELQDLSGYDLEVMRDLLRSKISVTLVGDPRQATYSTNRSSKNKQFKRVGVFDWVEERKQAKELEVEYSTNSHRCTQKILDIADALFPSLPTTTS
ncbi:MAG TPA: UvrD-helicase domain-containing protein, partial [Candidatus Kryptobacter bacterium]|nr:UvrD-helicase domain-containing protein [Candidatus Kryptobacter bacterium]